MQLVLDELYAASVKGQRFCNLVELIKRPENIKLAYRNIRKNSGSRTAGVDNKTISDLNKWNENALVAHVQRKLDWYIPNAVRRVEIPKDNGKTRPLGIPTIMDRLIQQCILQVLEPICEAKFFKRSNGFRPNHSAENAIAQAERMIQNVGCHYVIDIDIKSFFDNVLHACPSALFQVAKSHCGQRLFHPGAVLTAPYIRKYSFKKLRTRMCSQLFFRDKCFRGR